MVLPAYQSEILESFHLKNHSPLRLFYGFVVVFNTLVVSNSFQVYQKMENMIQGVSAPVSALGSILDPHGIFVIVHPNVGMLSLSPKFTPISLVFFLSVLAPKCGLLVPSQTEPTLRLRGSTWAGVAWVSTSFQIGPLRTRPSQVIPQYFNYQHLTRFLCLSFTGLCHLFRLELLMAKTPISPTPRPVLCHQRPATWKGCAWNLGCGLWLFLPANVRQ